MTTYATEPLSALERQDRAQTARTVLKIVLRSACKRYAVRVMRTRFGGAELFVEDAEQTDSDGCPLTVMQGDLPATETWLGRYGVAIERDEILAIEDATRDALA